MVGGRLAIVQQCSLHQPEIVSDQKWFLMSSMNSKLDDGVIEAFLLILKFQSLLFYIFADALLADLQNNVPGSNLQAANGTNGTSGYGCLKGAKKKEHQVSYYANFVGLEQLNPQCACSCVDFHRP